MATSPIGLEINENHIRIADAHFRGKVVYLQALGVTDSLPQYFVNIDSDIATQKQAQIIHKLYGDLKLSNKQVNVVIPDTLSYSQIIEMPILPEKELISAVRFQADEFIPMSIDETYLDLEVLHTDESTKRMSILIAAAPKKLVDGVFRTIQLAGLEANRLETEVCSIGRLVSEIMKSSPLKEAYCVLNLGFSGSSLYFIDNTTHTIEFIKSTKVGYEVILKEIMVNLNLDLANAIMALHKPNERGKEVLDAMLTSIRELATEIQRSVDVYIHKKNLPVTRIFTVNYASQIYGFTAIMAELTKLYVEPLPLNTVYVPNTVLKVFSSEITEFAAVVSTSIL
ncbi:pilus assembly protein PilM [Candidatus Woesebacteria bacterium]|nr:pilus assembly protein PilM [Candidatus Woesebacteria bacterium]